MLRYIDSKKMGRGKRDWLDSHFHFSFAEYDNPENMNFGALRVINDDLIKPGTGFGMHPHENMEIISYVVRGEITHADSVKNQRTLPRGQVQYMSAGTGIWHSEHNMGKDMLRLLQIWILPDKKGYAPNCGDYAFNWADRVNKWMPIVTGNAESPAPIRIHADINMYVAEIETGKELTFKVASGRQAYLVLMEGSAQIAEHTLNERDAMEITEEDILLQPIKTTHVLIIEMEKS